jgi:hypothetical protein
VAVCGTILSCAASAFGVSTGRAQQCVQGVGQAGPAIAPGKQAPALLRRGLQPVQLAQALARAFGDQMQAGDGPGNCATPAGEAIGGIGAQRRQGVAVAGADRQVGAPERHEDAARCTAPLPSAARS